MALLLAATATALLAPGPARDARPEAREGPAREPADVAEPDRLRRPLTLRDCIAIALEKNLTLKIAEAELRRARGLHTASLGRFLPVLSASASRQRSVERTAKLDDTGARIDERSVVESQTASGGVVQELPSGAVLDVSHALGPDERQPGRTRSRGLRATLTQPLLRGAGPTVSLADVRASGYDASASAQDLIDVRQQTVLAVRLAYYTVLRDRELLRVNRGALDADSLLVEASNAMVEAKVASRRDILSARIRLSDDASTVVTSERDLQLSLDQLKDVMGVPLETELAVADTGLDVRIVSLDEQDLIRRVLETHPSLRSAQFAVSHSRLDLAVARNSRWPQLDLEASYLGSFDSDLNVLAEDRRRGWLAGVSLRLPLFDRAAAGATLVRGAELSQAEDRLALLQRQLTLRVRDIVRTVGTSSDEILAIQSTIEAADEKLRFANAMFNLGRASNLDITDARASLVKARTQLVRKWVDYHSQLALLESLTGEPVGP